MNKRSTTNLVAVCTLIVYGTLALVSVPLHFHGEDLFTSGPGVLSFTQHADAGHCAHKPLEAHQDDCTLCTIISHSLQTRLLAVLPAPETRPATFSDAHRGDTLQPFHSTPTLRGPPSLFV